MEGEGIKQKDSEIIKASEGKLRFSDALRQVYSENPGLKESYETALASEAK